MGILDKLRGGDLRSIGRSNEVAAAIREKPSLMQDVFRGLGSDDPVVRARSADAIEKASKNDPSLLAPFKKEIIAILKRDVQQEVCWHMAQIVPRLMYTPSEKKGIAATLKKYLEHKSAIVQVSAMEALTELAESNGEGLPEVTNMIHRQMKTGSPAVRARGRKLLKRLGA
jgi:HEAT repeat protein